MMKTNSSIYTEHTIQTIDKCFAFQIPSQTDASGHRAETWPNQPAWCGQLILSRQGDALTARLVDSRAAAQVFATCPIATPLAVQKTLDSSRYFVLRIVEPGPRHRHAFIGIAFDSRSDAFDFNVTINDHLQQLKRETLSESASDVVPKDYVLPPGETMQIQIGRQVKETPSAHSFADWERF